MSGTTPTLPPQVRVFVRDWLSSNNILLKGREGHVLIDSGYVRHAPLTLELLATPQGLGAAPLARLVNTHCHSDHMGGNAAIKTRYGCPIALPEEEAPLIDAWSRSRRAASSRARSAISWCRMDAVERKKASVGMPVRSAAITTRFSSARTA